MQQHPNINPHPHAHTHPHQQQHQYQQQQQQHINQHQQSFQPHVPVGMNRSYSSSSSTGFSSGGGNNSGGNAGSHNTNKKANLLYDYSVLTTPSYDGISKGTSSESEKVPSLSHILEIHEYDAQDDIFEDLVLPPGAKLRRLKASTKDPLGQCLVVFKNATLAAEALQAFQDGRETWMGPEARLKFEPTDQVSKQSNEMDGGTDAKDGSGNKGVEKGEGEGEEGEAGGDDDRGKEKTAVGRVVRIQQRFNVKVWTPVLVNNTTPTFGVVATVGGSESSSPIKSMAQAASSDPSNSSNNNNNNNTNNNSNSDSSSIPKEAPSDQAFEPIESSEVESTQGEDSLETK
ncbi:hypothetical protein BX616_002057 [Lobosporangium transversale]|nr:hypothetical protein BX616_002057 [Lobosporangium transversale]